MKEELLASRSDKPDVVLLGIPYDNTSSFRKGADKGPEAILKCFNTQLEQYDRYSGWAPSRNLSITSTVMQDIREETPRDMISKVASQVDALRQSGSFVLGLGGEHSTTAGILMAWKDEARDITVLQLDAHLDLRDDDSDYNDEPDRHAHSCVMKRALDHGFSIVPVGIRAYADFEMETAEKRGIPVFEWPQPETEDTIARILSGIKTRKVYITLDVDGLDPSVMPGTGTPVPGGLSWYFTLDLLKEIFAKKEVIGADIVETAPQRDNVITEYAAAQLAYTMIGLKFRGNK